MQVLKLSSLDNILMKVQHERGHPSETHVATTLLMRESWSEFCLSG
jgi:hypothetical protein